MVLVDTSVWVEHLRRGEPKLVSLLENAEVLCHPFIVGELACGNLHRRGEVLRLLSALPSLPAVSSGEILPFIERNRLQGKGLGLIDMHLLASCTLAGQPLWTLDRRLARAAASLAVGTH
jgi:predicted nucleic acid-binding protein